MKLIITNPERTGSKRVRNPLSQPESSIVDSIESRLSRLRLEVHCVNVDTASSFGWLKLKILGNYAL